MKKLSLYIFLVLMWCNNSNAALIYEGESILDIFDFDSQFWQDFGKEGVLRYYFLVLLLALFFWFLNGVGFLEEKISNIFGKKNALDFFRKDIPSDNLLRKKRKKKRKKK